MPYERNSVKKMDRSEELICLKELKEDLTETAIFQLSILWLIEIL